MLTKFPSNFIFFDLVSLFEIKLRVPKSSFFSSKKSKKDKFDFFSPFFVGIKNNKAQGSALGGTRCAEKAGVDKKRVQKMSKLGGSGACGGRA